MPDPSYDAITAAGGWSILAAASRSIISEDRRSMIGFLRGFVMALFVGIIVGFLVQNYSLSISLSNAIVGVTSFCADDILLMILTASAAIRKDPKEAFLNLLQYIFGRSKTD